MDHGSCHETIAANIGSPYLQILSLGLIWVFLHCAPMCGPIVSGLNLNKELHPVIAISFYQLGRAIIYGIAGAIAGAFGSSFKLIPELGWIVVGILGILLLNQIFPLLPRSSEKIPKIFYKLSSLVGRISGWRKPFFFGLLFAFLPCMLTAWALTLAASTKSALSGIFLMLLLLAMTTIPLLSVTWGFSKLFKLHQKKVSIYLISISFIWTLLVTAAANEIIPHIHLEFQLLQQSYKLMFW